MKRLSRLRAALALALTGLLTITGIAAPSTSARAATTTSLSLSALKARAIYYVQAPDATQRSIVLGSMTAASAREGELWTAFTNSWVSTNASMAMNYGVPSGLPAQGHVFVVLGSALSASGAMSTKLERRLKLAKTALAKYPAAKVLVSGGAPKNGKTEAAVMRAWLVAKGIASSRILVEPESASTIGNAKNSMALLSRSSAYTSYTLISDASHLRRASTLFRAATVLIQEQTGEAWAIKPVSNLAYPDLAGAGKGALSASSVAYTAGNVASLFGLSGQYTPLLSSAPSAAVLTSLALTAPAKLTYPVGGDLDTKGMVVTAVYDKGLLTRPVTGSSGITGFSSATVRTATATVTYTERGVTKAATFDYSITKATSKVSLKLSTTKVVKSKTKVVVTATVTSSAGVVPTGDVTFSLDGTTLKTVTLASAQKGKVSYTYPKIAKAGTHEIRISYAGNSRLKSATSDMDLKVTG